jgi:hypothetical protein
MAVYFAPDTFLPALNSGENFLKLRDVNGTIRYKIYNNTVSSIYNNLDTVVIKLKPDSKILNLKFNTSADAQNASVKLQAALAKIKDNYQTSKDSKFSDLSFELYNDTVKSSKINFNLANVTGAKTLSFGNGTTLQTESEVNATLNNETQFRFFEHFLVPHKLVQGSYTTATLRNKANEENHKGVFEMTLNSPNSDAYLYSGSNSFLLDNFNFNINLRINNLIDSQNTYRIIVGFFNSNTMSSINRGAYFTYDYSLNNNWLVRTQDSTSTLQNTLVPADTNWHNFGMQMNENSELEFLIDDIIVSAIDTNIPNQLGSEVAFGVLFEKIDSTTASSLYIDWIKMSANL